MFPLVLIALAGATGLYYALRAVPPTMTAKLSITSIPVNGVPNFAKSEFFKKEVREHVKSWNIDLEYAKKGHTLSQRRVRNGLTDVKKWINLHQKSKDSENYEDNYFYWLEKLTSLEVPVLRAAFLKWEKP
jgi:hypothetical protein